MIVNAGLAIALAYLLGSIPTAYLVTRWRRGVDIREVGERYAGAKNVFLQVGPAAGVATALVDLAKGTLAVLIARALLVPDFVLVLAGLAAVAGHIWPVYLDLRGGAGFATALGVAIAALPRETAILLVPYVIMVAVLRGRVGPGPAAAVLLLPLLILAWVFAEPVATIILQVLVAVLVAARVYWSEFSGLVARIARPAE